jgi:hypothetical protein
MSNTRSPVAAAAGVPQRADPLPLAPAMAVAGQDLTHAVQHYVERETVVTNHRRRRNQETAHRGARVDRPAPSSPDEVAVLANRARIVSLGVEEHH